MEEQAGLLGLPSERRMESSSSTPYESAACSPRGSADVATFSYFSVSAPSCPVTIMCDIRSLPATGRSIVIPSSDEKMEEPSSEDFDFSARFSETDPPWSPAPMSSADELFFNGQIRPLWFNCEDLIQLSSDSKLNGDDDDSHFDFRSSADYKFSMFSAPHSPTSAMNKLQKYVGYSYNSPSLHENLVRSHGQLNQGVQEEAGEAQRTKGIVPKWRTYSRQGQDDTIANQAMMVKVEESRGRHAGGNKEGGVRRTRSLSPLRVFHMDDELPRQSFETDQSSHSFKGGGGDERENEEGASRKGRRSTLKELLHSSSRVERMPSQKQGERQQNKAHMEMEVKMKERSALCCKSSPKHTLGIKLKGFNHTSQHLCAHHQASISPHGLHYASQRVHTDQIRQHTFLPYRRGLLSCLGFTSKSYHSVGGIQTFHSKSQGAR